LKKKKINYRDSFYRVQIKSNIGLFLGWQSGRTALAAPRLARKNVGWVGLSRKVIAG